MKATSRTIVRDESNVVRDGFGTLSLQNGDKYIGGFKNGVVNGHGTYQAKGAQPI